MTRSTWIKVILLTIGCSGCNASQPDADNTPPAVVLIAPLGFQSIGSTYTIEWLTTDSEPGVVQIQYSNDSGATFPASVAADLPDTGSYTWDATSVAETTTARIRVVATNGAGNTGAPADSAADFSIDHTAPPVPIVSLTAPVQSETDLTPEVFGNAEPASTVEIFTDSACTVSTGATGGAGSFKNLGITVGVAANSSTQLFATATDAAGNKSACSTSSVTYITFDITAPTAPTLTSTAPASSAADLTPEILGSAEAGSSVELFSDSLCENSTGVLGTAAAFASPGLTVIVPSDSINYYWARATDAAGNSSNCSASGVGYAHVSAPNVPPFFFNLPSTVACVPGDPLMFSTVGFDLDPLTYSEGSSSTCSFPAQTVATDGTVSLTCESTAADCVMEIVMDDGFNLPVSGLLTVSPASTRFVDGDVATSGDGTSWSTAFKTIQEGVDAVVPSLPFSPHGAVWVKEGVYRADTDSTPVVTIAGSARLYGGFVGNETSISQRDIPAYPTILDGDRDGAGAGVDDSPSVIVATQVGGGRLDGFTIRNGNGGPRGAGLFIGENFFSSNPYIISSCRFMNNTVNDPPTSGWGGALFIGSPNVKVMDSAFESNSIVGSGTGNVFGGAIYVGKSDSTHPYVDNIVIANSTFTDNFISRPGGGQDGGAVYFSGEVGGGQSATIINSLFADNYVADGGVYGRGGAITTGIDNLNILNSTFAYNAVGTSSTFSEGGAVHADISSSETVLIQNSVFYGNSALTSPDVHAVAGDTVEYSCVEGGFAGTNNQSLTVDPFTLAGDEFLLNAEPAGGLLCVDAGLNSAADDTSVGYPLLELEWRDLTTQIDRASETDVDGSGAEVIDAGVHYVP